MAPGLYKIVVSTLIALSLGCLGYSVNAVMNFNKLAIETSGVTNIRDIPCEDLEFLIRVATIESERYVNLTYKCAEFFRGKQGAKCSLFYIESRLWTSTGVQLEDTFKHKMCPKVKSP